MLKKISTGYLPETTIDTIVNLGKKTYLIVYIRLKKINNDS